LSENIEFENENQYRDKIQTIKESYFGNDFSESSSSYLTEEGSENVLKNNNPTMNVYMNAISKHSTANKTK